MAMRWICGGPQHYLEVDAGGLDGAVQGTGGESCLIMERRPSRTEAGPAQSVAWAGEPGPKGRSPRRYVIPMCDAYLL